MNMLGNIITGGLVRMERVMEMELDSWVAAVCLLVSCVGLYLLNRPPAAKRVIHLDDIGHPSYHPVWLLGNLVGDLLNLWPLDAEPLIQTAMRRTGLRDLGDETLFPFREGMKVFLDTAQDPATRMTAMGRLRFSELVIQLVMTRLKVQELISKHPEILEEKVDSPIFIVGLPRSGTTHLYWTLAEHSEIRAPVFYEMVNPVIKFNFFERMLWKAGYDPRYTKGFMGFEFSKSLRPYYQAMHDSGPNRPEEDMMLTAVTFQSLLFAVFVSSDKYLNWYKSQDCTMPIKYLRIILQTMQWQAAQMGLPKRRWLLKSIDHIQHLRAIREVFPDSIVVQTHRDPETVIPSSVTLVAYGCGMNCCPVDLPMMGALWTEYLEAMLRDFVIEQKCHGKGRVCNVMFNDFVVDNMREVSRVLTLADLELDSKNLKKMEHFISKNRRYRRGKVAYSLSRFGVDEEALKKKVMFYRQHFKVSRDGTK